VVVVVVRRGRGLMGGATSGSGKYKIKTSYLTLITLSQSRQAVIISRSITYYQQNVFIMSLYILSSML